MDTNELKSFIAAAKSGSFQKAAEQLFLSSTALIKQINGLENELGFKLFIRTNKGILLTESGKAFYDASQDILFRCAEAVQNARDRSYQGSEPIRIGFSPVNPYQNVFDRYYYSPNTDGIDDSFTPIITPISGEFSDFMEELKNLGAHVDVIPFFMGNKYMEPFCKSFSLARIPMCVAVPLNHPLAKKGTLSFDDLNGQELVTLADTVNSYYKEFHRTILEKAPHVRLRPVNFIDFSLLNETVIEQHLLLAGEYLRSAHPLLRFIRFEEDLLIPYGLYYSPTPSQGVINLIKAFADNGLSGNPEDSPIVSFRDSMKMKNLI